MPSDITVVIPSCNRPRLIEGTLRCLLPSHERLAGEGRISAAAQALGRGGGAGAKVAESARCKIFGVGMFKTGTTSFGEAMTLLGYRSRFRFMPLLDNLSGYFDLDPRQFVPFEDVIRREAGRFDAFADAPWLYLYRQLSTWYPDSRFVLTMRADADAVARSDLAHWERHGLMTRWMREVGKAPTRQMFIERYEKHNENVLNFFRDESHRLLKVCWEEDPNPWRRLCEFVGAEVPDQPFPHANRSPNSPLKK